VIDDPQSRVLKFFHSKYNFKKPLNGAEAERVSKTVSKQLEVVFGGLFTPRVTKNILCKAFRLLSERGNEDLKWCDTTSETQLLFKFEHGGSVTILHRDGREESIDGDYVISRFPYGDQLMTMREIVEDLCLPREMPMVTTMRRFKFYEKIMSPRQHFELEFALPRIEPLSKVGVETSRKFLSKWIYAERQVPRKRICVRI
jgi:hypothetical protein